MEYRLEAIELQGVKTFANITRLEFPGKITAIVGPNGSGKSNIADAIRWVLGEQSFSLLRAKKTEDMIFSGSQQRSRSGMAATTITFNNQDGWLPIDYAHVAITRQAYRDGQNEYLLNGQKVRLKDINELLSQTGLSERNYSIIGQGLVDVALSLKPDERRKLFEEAAGIGLYRSRKEESLRRLENTRKNLDRVLDILAEIKPRMRSLERQSEKYGEYQRLQSDLKALLREWYGYQWRQKQQDLQNARQVYQKQETQLSVIRQEHTKTQSSVDENRAEMQNNRKLLEAALLEQSENFRKLEKTTRDLAIVDERHQSNQRQVESLLIDITNLEQEKNELESSEREILSELDQRNADFSNAENETLKAQRYLSEIARKKDEIDTDLNKTRQSRLDFETKKLLAAARLEELNHRIDNTNTEREKIQAAINNLKDDLLRSEHKVKLLENNYQDLIIQVGKYNQQRKITGEELDILNNEKRGFSEEIYKLEAQLAKTQTQITLLEQAESALNGYSEGSKTIMQKAQKGHLPKDIEPLSRHLLIEEKYEKAINAALGELIDLLVLPAQSIKVLVEYLESNENERVSLADPLLVRSDEIKTIPRSQEGFIGYANELITVPKPYQALINNLFSDIIVVTNVNTARIIQKEFRLKQKIVTLSGLVFHPNGLIISGESPTGKRIGRSRQQSQLTDSLDKQKADITKLKEKEAELLNAIEKIKLTIIDLDQSIKELQVKQTDFAKDLQGAKDVLSRNREQLVWHQERLNSLLEDCSGTKTQIQFEEKRLKEIDNQIQSTKGIELNLVEKLNGLPLFEAQQSVNHWQTQQAILLNTLKMAQQRSDDYKSRKNSISERLLSLQNRHKELKKFQQQTETQKDLFTKNIEEIQEEIEIIKLEKVDPLSAANTKIEKRIESLRDLETKTQNKVAISERQFTQSQLELNRKQDQLNNLIEKIQDDFGAVSYNDGQKFGVQTPLPFDEKFIEELPTLEELPASHADEIKRLKIQIRQVGAVNPEAQEEYIEVKERFEFLTNQVTDLEKASEDLQEVIAELDKMMKEDFLYTYKAVNREFSMFFSRLFNGGEASLVFSDESNPVEGGIDIDARLPGRRQQGLASLSGGERSLTAVALIFALLKVSPPPFCILDEVDAMLDESNVGRFIEVLRELSKMIQVVIITHNRNTVQAANVIYGVTMGRDSTSQMISLKLEEVGDSYFE